MDLVFRVTEGTPTVTSFPINNENCFAPASETQPVRPGESLTWHVSGSPGAVVNFSASRIAFSGGHLHSGGPTGHYSPNPVKLIGPYPQNALVTFKAPKVGGTIVTTITWHFEDGGQPIVTKTFTRVTIPDLVELAGGSGMVLTGATELHPSNHYATSLFLQKLSDLASSFHDQFKKVIFVNDIALEDGGLFDIHGDWHTPHKTHNTGQIVDVNSTSMTKGERVWFRNKCAELGFTTLLESDPPHWHVTLA